MSKHDCKCKKSAECEECPEWIFTFADLVMLMMGFFVILWVLKPSPSKSQADAGSPNDDWIAVAAAVREAFGYMPDPHSKDPVDLHMLLKKMHTVNPVKGPTPGSKAHIEAQGAHGTDPEVTSIREGERSMIGGRILFDRGTVDLTGVSRNSLDQIVTRIRGHFNIVMIKGHSALDDLAEGATAQQLMDLSIRRAQAVADYLSTKGVDAQVLRIQGCSTYEPIDDRAYSAEAQTPNRRVEIEVTAALVGDRQGDRKSVPMTKPSSSTQQPAL